MRFFKFIKLQRLSFSLFLSLRNKCKVANAFKKARDKKLLKCCGLAKFTLICFGGEVFTQHFSLLRDYGNNWMLVKPKALGRKTEAAGASVALKVGS